MPAKTFENLSGAKKKQINKVAIKEFALNDFESASITAMVKELGIAKGSIYQYFTDKEDMYLFLLNDVWEKKIDLHRKSTRNKSRDIRQLFFQINLIGLKFDLNFPDYAYFLSKANNEQYRINGKTISSFQITRGTDFFESQLVKNDLKFSEYLPFLLYQLSSGLFNKLLMDYGIDVVQLLNDQQPVDIISDQQLIKFVTEISKTVF